MSIGEQYTGVEGFGVPTQYGNPVFNSVVLDDIKIAYKSICVITRDQDPPSSPTCFYEFELDFCPRGDKCRKGRFTAHGSGPRNLQITGGSDDFFGAYGQVRIFINYESFLMFVTLSSILANFYFSFMIIN